MRTPVQQDGCPTSNDSTLRTPNHVSDVSRASFRPTTTASHALFKSTTVASNPLGSTFAQGSYDDSSGIVPAAEMADVSKTNSLLLKKSRCVNLGERIKLCTQRIDDSISSWLKATPSKFTLEFGKS